MIRNESPQGSVEEVRRELQGSRFTSQLRNFQWRDLAKIIALDHGANFSVPGAGKTRVQLAAYEVERQRGRVDRLLVVAPLSAFGSWTEEVTLCLDPAPRVHMYAGGAIPVGAEIVLTNYQRLASSFEVISAWVSGQPSMVVLDEAHRMKRGRDGEWGSACLDLAFFAARRDILSGTPAPQHPFDLVAILDFLWPGQALRVLPPRALFANPSPIDVAEITPAIAPLFVRTTKNELELRAPIMHIVPVALEGLQREIYNSLRARLSRLVVGRRERVQMNAWGKVIMYLLEAATNPALLPAGSTAGDPIDFRHPPLEIPDGASLGQLIEEYASFETPLKFIQLAAMVDELVRENRKVLIWSNFVRNLETLERMLSRYEPAIVHGGIPSEISSPLALRKREDEIRRFRTDGHCMVLLANPAAMGEGVSLHQTCHDAIYLDRTFNAGQYLQSVDRIHRLGLDNETETNITFLVTADTVDEIVASRIQAKTANLGIMLNDPSIVTMALPDDEDIGPPIDVGDEADIAALFAHLRGEQYGE